MSSIWKTLGVPHTADRDEIRRAYAKRLKLTNPEDDPEGFQRLRQAYEAALDHVQYANWNDLDVDEYDNEEEEEPELQTVGYEDAPLPPPQRPEPELEPGAWGGDVHVDPHVNHQMVCNRFAVLLADAAETGRLRAALEDVLRSRALSDISTYHSTELWLADNLAAAGAAADPLLDRAIDFFDWIDAGRRFDTPLEIIQVLERSDTRDALSEFDRPTHPRRKAYQLLKQRPASFSRWQRATLGLQAKKIQSFIAWLEAERPGLLQTFDPETIDWWRDYFARRRRPVLTWIITVFVIIALNIGFRSLDDLVFAREDRIETLAREQPGNPGAQADLCRLRSRLEFAAGDRKSYEQALTACERALDLNPQSLIALDGRALLLLRDLKAEAAFDDYERILKLSPHDARALFGRGFARTRLGDAEGGMEDIGLAKASDPDVHETFMQGLGFRLDVTPIQAASERPQDREPPPFMIRIPTGGTLSEPEWVTKPSLGPYPTFAERADKSGHATLRCAISRGGLARDCIIWSENPQDFGFGEAALALVPQARFKPAAINGEPLDGAPLMIPFSFTREDG